MFNVGDTVRSKKTGGLVRIVSIGSSPRPDGGDPILYNVQALSGGVSTNVRTEEIEKLRVPAES